ncbi:hypothetical protein [Litorimonas haliclonae]|uniref:hypothetical protein n=1 Tax=Litorimonas haliclonae TaxID=2081977 RepID=UPI0039EFBC8E
MTRLKLASATLAALIAMPALASAQDRYENRAYEDCKRSDTQNQVLGGAVGGSLGAISGNEIGDDEGAVIGGIAGGTAGVAIADKDCSRFEYDRYDRRDVRGDVIYNDRYYRGDDGRRYYRGDDGHEYYRDVDGRYYRKGKKYKGPNHPSYNAPGQVKKRYNK